MLLIPLFSRLQLGCIWSFVMFLICLSTVSCGIYLDWSLWICLWLFCVCDSFLYYCFAFVDTILRLIFIDNFRMLRKHIVIYRLINKPITIRSFFSNTYHLSIKISHQRRTRSVLSNDRLQIVGYPNATFSISRNLIVSRAARHVDPAYRRYARKLRYPTRSGSDLSEIDS